MISELPYLTALLMLSAALAWLPSAFAFAGALTAITYVTAAVLGYVQPLGLLAVVLCMLMAHICSRSIWITNKKIAEISFFILCIALSVHVFPGFQNPILIGPVQFSPDAYPFKMYLNLDKAAVGLSIFLLYRPLRRGEGIQTSLAWAAAGAFATVLVLLPPALLFKAVVWEPKLPPEFGLWALNNLLLVAFTEEALFRGFLQSNLARWFENYSMSQWIGLGVSAVAFGIMHYSGGPIMVVFASVAGAIYGYAFRKGGLLASTLAHFGLNAAHLLLFTYPLRMIPSATW